MCNLHTFGHSEVDRTAQCGYPPLGLAIATLRATRFLVRVDAREARRTRLQHTVTTPVTQRRHGHTERHGWSVDLGREDRSCWIVVRRPPSRDNSGETLGRLFMALTRRTQRVSAEGTPPRPAKHGTPAALMCQAAILGPFGWRQDRQIATTPMDRHQAGGVVVSAGRSVFVTSRPGMSGAGRSRRRAPEHR